MAFCTKCGTPLEEGVAHKCAVEEVAATLTMHSSANKAELSKINLNVVLNLFKNPFYSLELTENEFL